TADINAPGADVTLSSDGTNIIVTSPSSETQAISGVTTLTIEAKTVTFASNVLIPNTDVTITVTDSQSGSPSSTDPAFETLSTANADAEITLDNFQLQAKSVTFIANATLNITPLSLGPVAYSNANSTAKIALLDAASIIASGLVSLTSTSKVTSVATTQGSSISSSTDAAVAVNILSSTAITQVSGTSFIHAGGTLTLAAANTVAATTTGDATSASGGAGIAVTTLHTVTKAYIDATGAQPTTGTSIAISADANDAAATSAKASPGGASQNNSGNDPNARTMGNAKVQGDGNNGTTSDGTTSSQSIPVAAAIAFTYLSDDTEAYVVGTNDLQAPAGTILVHASSVNAIPTKADGTTTSSSSAGSGSVGVAVAIQVDTVTTKAYVGGHNQLESPSTTVEAPMPSTGTTKDAYSSSAMSGHGDANTFAVAGSLALTVLTIDREATLPAGAVVGIGGSGDLSLTSESDAASDVKAVGRNDGVFDPKTAVSGTTITLPYKIKKSAADITTSDSLVYHNGGGTSIGGLVDQGTYKIINLNITANGESFQLSADGTSALPLTTSLVTGTEHSLVADGDVSGTGIGASFAINIVNDSTTSGIGDGTALTGARNVTITSKTGDEMTTEAQNGAQGKTAITPSVAVSISNVTTRATVGQTGADSGNTLAISGNLDVEATQTASVETKAEGDTQSSQAGIGASIAITSATHDAIARTYRNLQAGGFVTFLAAGASATVASSKASATGANDASHGGDSNKVDQQQGAQLGQANSAASHNGTSGANTQDTSSAPSASTGDSGGGGAGGSAQVSIAASVTYNLVHALDDASLPEGLTIVAGGPLTLSSSSNTDASATADGEAATMGQSGASVGAGVAINRVYEMNTANVTAGDGITSAGLILLAIMNPQQAGDQTHTFTAQATSGAQNSTTANINGSLALNIIDATTSALVTGTDPANPSRGPPSVNITSSGNVQMTATSTVSSTTKALAATLAFDPNASGSILNGNTIVLPQELTSASGTPVKSGDAVIYRAGGGNPIGVTGNSGSTADCTATSPTLKDGCTYYAHVVKPGYIQLDTSQSDAQSSSPTTILNLDPTQATGTEHTLELAADGGAKLGIGASVAVNLVNDTTSTGTGGDGNAAHGASITGAHDITLSSTGKDSLSTVAEGGSSGSVSISPSVSVSIPNVTTSASFGAGPGITATGKIDAKAEQEAELESSAKGDFNGTTVGIGISLSLTVPTDIVDSSSARDLTASSNISFEAKGSSHTSAETESSGQGEDSSSSGGENVNQKGDNQLASAKSAQSSNDANGKTTSASSTPSTSTGDSGGDLSLAAAVTINIVSSSSTATFANGTHISAGGKVSLSTTANTDAIGSARGDTDSKTAVGVGAGVAINLLSITNQASTGGTAVTGNGVEASAGMELGANDPIWRFNATATEPGWELVDSGTALPSSASGGDYFNLTAPAGAKPAGVYRYDGVNKKWLSQAAPGHVGSLPDPSTSPVDGTLDQTAAHEAQAVATSGASNGSTLVLAGSVAINIVHNHTEGVFAAGSGTPTVAAGTGDVKLSAYNNEVDVANAKATADGKSEKKSGDSGNGSDSGATVGIGASVSLNVLTDSHVRADIESGVALTGGANVDLEATSTRTVKTNVEAGANGGQNDIAPAVALVVLNHDTAEAKIGTSATGVSATGAITLHATHAVDASGTEGSADAAGSSVAIGADVSINILLDWTTNAELDRNATGTAVSVIADSSFQSGSSTKASAKGAESSDPGGSGDGQANNQVQNNPNAQGAGTGNLPQAGDQTQSANSTASSQSGDSGGDSSGVSIAAAVSVDWVSMSNTAIVASNVHVVATGGAILVGAHSQAEAKSKAIGLAVNLEGGDADIAAAIGFNYQNLTNSATVGSGAVLNSSGPGAGVTVEAITPAGKENDFVVWGLAGAGGKNDASVAASVGIQVVDFHTTASIGAGSTLTSAGGVTVSATAPIGWQTMVLSGGLSIDGSAVGGAIAVNVITPDSTLAFIDSGTGAGAVTHVDAAGALTVTATTSMVPLHLDLASLIGNSPSGKPRFSNDLLPPFTSLALAGGASSGDASVSGSVIVDTFTFDTEAYIAAGAQINQSTPGGSGQTVTVTAGNSTTLVNVAGGLALSTGDAGIGIGVLVDVIDKTVKASVGASAAVSAGGNVNVGATASESYFGLAVELGGSSSAGVTGSVVVVVLNSGGGTGEYASVGTGTSLISGGNVSVAASDTASNLTVITGNANYGGDAGVGVSASVLVRHSNVDAGIGSGASIGAAGATGLTVNATQTEGITIIAVGGSVGGDAGVAGSAAVDTNTDHTHAHIDSGVGVNCAGLSCTNSSSNATQGVAVAASDTTQILGIGGAVAAGGDAGIGAGVDVEVLSKDTTAKIDSLSGVNANGSVTVDATSSESVTSVAVGGSFGGSAAVAVNAGVSVFNITTDADIGASATVLAGDSVRVSADEGLTLNIIAGNVAASGTAAVGAAAAVPVVTKETHAWIDSGATVTGLGNGATGVAVASGAHDVTNFDPRFNPSHAIATSGSCAGSCIDLAADDPGFKHGFVENQAVRYDNGGGANIPSLDGGDYGSSSAPGKVYFVHVVNDHVIQLKTSADSTPAGGVETCGTGNVICGLSAPAGGGESQRFVGSNEVSVPRDSAPRFDANTDVGADGAHPNAIELPYNIDFATGDTVVYSAGGGTAINNLVDGQEYEAFVVGGNEVELCPKNVDTCNEAGSIAVSVTGGTDYGRSHSIVAKGDQPSGDASQLGPATMTAATAAGFHGVAVTATNSDNIAAVGASAGFSGTASINLSGAVNVVTANTTAYIATGAKINCNSDCSAGAGGSGAGQSVHVAAGDVYRQLGIAAVIAIAGTAGIGGGAAVAVVEETTKAWIDDNSSVHARDTISVLANEESTVTTVAVGVGGGEVGIAGSVSVFVLNDHTWAYAGNSVTLAADGNVFVAAADKTKLISVAGSIAGGLVGAAVGVGVISVNKDTQAYIGNFGTIDGRALGSSLAGLVSDGSAGGDCSGLGSCFGALGSFQGVAVQAGSSENIFGLAAAAGGGFVGVAGGVNVALAHASTKAFIGQHTQVNTLGGAGSAQSVNVAALDYVKTFTLGGGIGGGFVGVGGGVDIGVVDESVQAYLDANSNINAGNAVDVFALSHKNITTFALSLGAGFVGVAGSVSVYTIGTQPTTSYNQAAGGQDRGVWSSAVATAADTTQRYRKGDVVHFDPGDPLCQTAKTCLTYAAKTDGPTNNPTDASEWQAPDQPLAVGGSDAGSTADASANGSDQSPGGGSAERDQGYTSILKGTSNT
ncbi:MAG: mucin9, partial [Solirubrobacteraceae bacterium]|nr:mucin9 [Solirubrobacteraceae bacterium]